MKHELRLLRLALDGGHSRSGLTAKDARCAAVAALRVESHLHKLLPDESAA